MITPHMHREATLVKALAQIDPKKTLVPGTQAHKTIRGLRCEWIDQCGPDQAIFMARMGANHLERWRKFL